ncbi:hypothetical protein KW787_02395 [Candidatus Pacearchaeota archaeon]|nr:hypothetical protein [Candidatus Pacearchaeota archaeon]
MKLDEKIEQAFSAPNIITPLRSHEEVQAARLYLLRSSFHVSRKRVLYLDRGFDSVFTPKIYDALKERLQKNEVRVFLWESMAHVPSPCPSELASLYNQPYKFSLSISGVRKGNCHVSPFLRVGQGVVLGIPVKYDEHEKKEEIGILYTLSHDHKESPDYKKCKRLTDRISATFYDIWKSIPVDKEI